MVEGIRLAWVAYQTLNNQREFFKAHSDSSVKALSAYKQQFNMGQRTLLDVLDSTNEMYLAHQAYMDAKFNEVLARYRILAGMGRLNRYLGTVLPTEVVPITPDTKISNTMHTAALDQPMPRAVEDEHLNKTILSNDLTTDAMENSDQPVAPAAEHAVQ